jgi:hypothetical protein
MPEALFIYNKSRPLASVHTTQAIRKFCRTILPQLFYDAYFALADFQLFVRAEDSTRAQYYAVQEAL